MIVALLSVVPAGAASQKAPQPVRGITSLRISDSIDAPSSSEAQSERRRFWFENNLMNVYESNIEHDSTNIGSYGLVAGARARFRTGSAPAALQLEYAVAKHAYTGTERWNRVSQLGRIGLDMSLGMLLLGLTGEGSLKGSSEDREIGDQYAILPRLELRLTDNVRVRLIAAYRRRFYSEASGSNATNRYATGDARIRFSAVTLEAAARFEENLPQNPRNRFERATYLGRFTWLAGKRDALLTSVEYRPVRYPGRTVDIPIIDDDGEEDEIEVPRQDTRWKPEVGWVRKWNPNLRTELAYEYENRLSNEIEKQYRGHVVTFTMVLPW